MKNYRILLTLVICLFGSGIVASQTAYETRRLEKSFHVTDEMRLEVTNKYGKVHLTPSQVDSISIHIEVEANAPNSAKLRKLIEGVSFDLTSTDYVVIAKSNFNRGPVNFLESIRSITNNLISSESRLEINYYITAPSYVDISIDNRYGDIFIENMDNDFNVRLSNGSLRAEDLFGETSFNLDFFDAIFNSVRKARINALYGDLNIKTAGEIDLTSVASRIEIATVRDMQCKSKRDKYFIKEISSVDGESYFSDFSFEIVDNEVNLLTKYGSITIDRLGETVSLASIESTYTNVYINAGVAAACNFDIRLSNCLINFPENWALDKRILSEERNEFLYSGSKGEGDPKTKIILDMTRGRLILDEK